MFNDLTNQVFGKLTVVERAENKGHQTYWKCVCSCNNQNIKIVRASHLASGRIQSCGCLYSQRIRSKVGPNKFLFRDDYKVGITDKNEEFYYNIEYSEEVERYAWYFDKDGYVVACINKKGVKLHKLLTKKDSSIMIDHRNGLKYDNRIDNLRICNSSQNSSNVDIRKNNTSSVTGVYWHKHNNKWVVKIGIHKKSLYLGQFDDFKEAVKTRKEAELKYFGEYSRDLSKNFDVSVLR